MWLHLNAMIAYQRRCSGFDRIARMKLRLEREWEWWEVMELQDIRQYQEFISKNEINKDMDYMIQSYEEVNLSKISLL